ncbi:MAG: UPF0175 family protein, partial [Candidatus Thorarchaeota archaeon]
RYADSFFLCFWKCFCSTIALICIVNQMAIVQVRVDDAESKELDDLAELLGISKSDLIRKMIKIGKKELLFEYYYDRLLKKELSLARAAAATGMSIVEFLALAKDRGFVYFQYDEDELHRDLKALEGKLEK